MIRKIFSAIFGVALMSLLVGAASILWILYQDIGSLQEKKIKEELQLVSTGVEEFGQEYLRNLPKSDYRISWISASGNVIFDNLADVSRMDNHANREEVHEAIVSGRGISHRYSDTLVQKTLYLAKRLQDGSVLRMSISHDGLLVLLADVAVPVFGILLLLIFCSAVAAYRLSRQIIEPLKEMDFHGRTLRSPYPELKPILSCLQAQQKKNQEQYQRLVTKKRHFDQITESMQEGFILLDASYHIVQINQFARNVLHCQNTYQPVSIWDVCENRALRQAFQKMEEVGFTRFLDQRVDKAYLWKLNPVWVQNQRMGSIILIADNTDRILAEQHRKEFTANVSHELKTPLQTIIGSVELLESGVVQPEDQGKFIGHIRKEAKRLVSLIRDILYLARLDDGQVPEKRTVCLRNILEEVFEVLETASQNHQVQMHLSGDRGKIQGIPSFLFETFYNLCDNAVKYNHPKGRVWVHITESPVRVVVQVKDTGIGIPYEYQEKIFERFYRVDKSHSRQTGGTGLGLSIVKHAVQHHNGRIRLESHDGQGTVITVYFPKKDCVV